jgi:hypothetical protein
LKCKGRPPSLFGVWVVFLLSVMLEIRLMELSRKEDARDGRR